MDKTTKEKRAFKVAGEALKAVIEISNSTHRNLSGAIEYLILQGYQKHLEEAELLVSAKCK